MVAKDREYACRVVGEESVTVPAGTFNCYVIQGPDPSDREWVARGIGMVKWAGKEGTYELIEFGKAE